MRLVHCNVGAGPTLAARRGEDLIDLGKAVPGLPADLTAILAAGALDQIGDAIGNAPADSVIDDAVEYLPPLPAPPKIICVGLNYIDHASESPYEKPDYPVLFLRVSTSLVGHGQPMIRPTCSEQFDYEGELAAVIGTGGRHIPKETALDHVAGYSVFNDGSIRDYQFKSPQWTSGKNFDGTGGFGPDFVTADELPRGATGLRLTTRLNGETVQDANTSDLIFPIDEIIAVASEVMTLEPGDLLVTGTPAGVGAFRKPPLWMKDGDECEVEIEGVGLLSNPIANE